MVPTSLILLIWLAAFVICWIAYLSAWPYRRIVNRYFPMLAGSAAFMFFMITLAIIGVHIVWLSWVLLVAAILWMATSIPLFRKARWAARARERDIAQRRARGG
jgi:hypothetical protein